MTRMRFGLMLRAQFPSHDDLSKRFVEMIEQVRLAEKLGFASVTVGSHYGATSVRAFQQLPMLARLSAETQSLRLNAGVVLLPLHKPLDLAEQLATIDVMSQGRLIFGAAVGYREVEFEAFGTRRRDRVARFEQNLEAIKRLWAEESVTMSGSHFQLREVHCSIKPLQQPHPPIWIGADADAAVRRAARLGDSWYINPHVRIATVQRQLDIYRRELDACEKPFPEELPIRREVFVAQNRDDAIRLAKPHLANKYAVYREWGQQDALPDDDAELSEDFQDLAHDRFLLGSADDVAEKIVDLNRRTQANHLVMSVYWAGTPQGLILETMHRLAQDVFPMVERALV